MIGVVMACWNVGPYVQRAVESLLEQRGVEWRAVIVDDGSTDDTAYLLEKAARKRNWPREGVQSMTLPHGGLPTAVNVGVAALPSEVTAVTCLAGDDMIGRHYLEFLARALNEWPRAPCVYPRVCEFGARTGFWYPGPWVAGRLRTSNTVPGCAVWRRQHWTALGGFDPAFRAGNEDWAFAAKAEAVGVLSYYAQPVEVAGALYYHRARAKSLTEEMTEDYKTWCRARIAEILPEPPTHERVHRVGSADHIVLAEVPH
jgi:glycogen synthase